MVFEETPETVAIERHHDETDKQEEHTVFEGNIRLADWNMADDSHLVGGLEEVRHLFERKGFAQVPDAVHYGRHTSVEQCRSM